MDGLELWHESVARATLYSNGLVSNKATNGSIGHLHGFLGMVEAHGAVLVEICRLLQWCEICLVICREVSKLRSRAYCSKRGRNAALSECWMFPSACVLLDLWLRGD